MPYRENYIIEEKKRKQYSWARWFIRVIRLINRNSTNSSIKTKTTKPAKVSYKMTGWAWMYLVNFIVAAINVGINILNPSWWFFVWLFLSSYWLGQLVNELRKNRVITEGKKKTSWSFSAGGSKISYESRYEATKSARRETSNVTMYKE